MGDGGPIRAAVCGRNLQDLHDLLRNFPVEVTEENPDLVIAYGGDGALLGAERAYPGVPKFPFRDWRQNPKCHAHDDRVVLDQLVQGSLTETRLAKLVATSDSGGHVEGINDICISKTIITSAVRYRLWLGPELYKSQIVADGLVVSTPFGSTGYYRSITNSSFRVGIGLAFNNSTEPIDHIVIEDRTPVRLRILRGPAALVADNDPQLVDLREGEYVTIRRRNEETLAYGLDVFRCKECWSLRQDGLV